MHSWTFRHFSVTFAEMTEESVINFKGISSPAETR